MVRQLGNGKYKNAKIFVRVLPLEKMCWEHVKILDDNKTIYVRYLQDFERGNEDKVASYWNFQTDGVFYNTTQKDIYETIKIPDLLESALKGHNVIILGYGQTGSGKSLTISGLECSYEDRGISSRIIYDLFELKHNLRDQQTINIRMSYIETKKVYAVDLLSHNYMKLLDMNAIKNVTSIEISDLMQALETLFKAEGRRDVVNNKLYNSHAANGVLTLEVTSSKNLVPAKICAKIHIVDLAGADTIGNITCFYKSVFEVGNANLAKTHLEQFLLILCENISEKVVVKQRLNILILYLRDSLNTCSIIRLIGHIRTNLEDLKLTLSMLRFAQIVRGLKSNELMVNVNNYEEAVPSPLLKELDDIKKEKILHAMFNSKDLSTNLDQERIKHLHNITEEYLKDKVNEFVILNVSDVKVAFGVFKELYNKLETEKAHSAQIAYDKALDDFSATSKSLKKDGSGSIKGSRKGSKLSNKSKKSGGSHTSKISKTSASNPLPLEAEKKVVEKPGQSDIFLPKISSQDRRSSIKSIKQSKTSSRSIKRLSSGRRRSSTSSDFGIKEKSFPEETEYMELPTEVPSREVAWNVYILDTNYNYKELSEANEKCELQAKEAYRNYLKQVTLLQELVDVLDTRKEELFKVKLQKNIHVNDNNLESVCKTNLVQAEQKVVEQQETVLKYQTELHLCTQGLQDAKKKIKNEFDNFCTEKFKLILPNMAASIHSECVEEFLENIEVSKEENDDVLMVEKFDELKKYATLQNLMKKEAALKEIKMKKKKWIKYLKAP